MLNASPCSKNKERHQRDNSRYETLHRVAENSTRALFLARCEWSPRLKAREMYLHLSLYFSLHATFLFLRPGPSLSHAFPPRIDRRGASRSLRRNHRTEIPDRPLRFMVKFRVCTRYANIAERYAASKDFAIHNIFQLNVPFRR